MDKSENKSAFEEGTKRAITLSFIEAVKNINDLSTQIVDKLVTTLTRLQRCHAKQIVATLCYLFSSITRPASKTPNCARLQKMIGEDLVRTTPLADFSMYTYASYAKT